MSLLYPLGFVLPTDAPMPHPSIADIVADMEEICDYSGAGESVMSRFQWLANQFKVVISGKVSFRANGSTSIPTWIDHDIEFEVGADEVTEQTAIANYDTVDARFPAEPFEAGDWASFTSLPTFRTSVAPMPIPGGPTVINDDGDTISNYRIFWSVRVGAFESDPPKGIIGTPHLIKSGDSYKIPFQARLVFVADYSRIVEGDPVGPIIVEAASPHYGLFGTTIPENMTRLVGGAEVTNGDAELFPISGGGGVGISIGLYGGPEGGELVDNAVYFAEANISIRASELAELP